MENQNTKGLLIGSYAAENFGKFRFKPGNPIMAIDTSKEVLDSIDAPDLKPIFFELNGVKPSKLNPDLLFKGTFAGAGLIEVHPNESYKLGEIRSSLKEFTRTASILNAVISAGGGSSNGFYPSFYNDILEYSHVRKHLVHVINPSVHPEKMVRRLYDLHSLPNEKNVIHFICKDIYSASKLWTVLESSKIDRFIAIMINTPAFKKTDESNFSAVLHCQLEIPLGDFKNSILKICTSNKLKDRFENGSPNLIASNITSCKNQIAASLNAIINKLNKHYSFNLDQWQYLNELTLLIEKYIITLDTIVLNSYKEIKKHISDVVSQLNNVGLNNANDLLNDFTKRINNMANGYANSLQNSNRNKLLNEFANCNKGFFKYFKKSKLDGIFNEIAELLSIDIKHNLIEQLLSEINPMIFQPYSDCNNVDNTEFKYDSKTINDLTEIALSQSDIQLRNKFLEESINKSTFLLLDEYLKNKIKDKLLLDFPISSQNVIDNFILLTSMPEKLYHNGLDKSIAKYLHINNAFVSSKVDTEDKIVLDLFAIINNIESIPSLLHLLEDDEKIQTNTNEIFSKRCRVVSDAFPTKIIRKNEPDRAELANLAVKAMLTKNSLTVNNKKGKTNLQFKLATKTLTLTNLGSPKISDITNNDLGFKEEKYLNDSFWNETFASDRKKLIADLEAIISGNDDSLRLKGLFNIFTIKVVKEEAEKILKQAQLANSFYSN